MEELVIVPVRGQDTLAWPASLWGAKGKAGSIVNIRRAPLKAGA